MSEQSLSQVKDAGSLAAMIKSASQGRNARGKAALPVNMWNPEFCGDLDMEIKSDGTWFYMGTPIGRMPLVQLFASVLRRDEDGKTYLVTPVEKVGIRVQDAHFLAVEMVAHEEDGHQALTFRTNLDELVEIGPEHALRFDIKGKDSELKPYFHVRGRLEALVSRAVMYDLVELGENIEVDGVAMFAVKSRGCVYPIMPMDELDAQIS